MIYFLESQCPTRFIKIGTATNLQVRMSKLQQGTPYPLKVLRVLRGGVVAERAIHRLFDRDRLHGEWFHPTPAVLGFIAHTAAECLGFDPEPEVPDAEDAFRRVRAARHRMDLKYRSGLEKRSIEPKEYYARQQQT